MYTLKHLLTEHNTLFTEFENITGWHGRYVIEITPLLSDSIRRCYGSNVSGLIFDIVTERITNGSNYEGVVPQT